MEQDAMRDFAPPPLIFFGFFCAKLGFAYYCSHKDAPLAPPPLVWWRVSLAR